MSLNFVSYILAGRTFCVSIIFSLLKALIKEMRFNTYRYCKLSSGSRYQAPAFYLSAYQLLKHTPNHKHKMSYSHHCCNNQSINNQSSIAIASKTRKPS